MKKKIIIIPIVLLLGALVIYMIASKRPYESRYFEKLGANRNKYLYRDMLKDFGAPKEIATHEMGAVIAIYDDFEMYFSATDDEAWLNGIGITGRKYRFGWRSIGVGSTKEEVFKAYKELTHYPEYDFYACVDGGINVEFYFDNNNIVDEIRFHDYARYGM